MINRYCMREFRKILTLEAYKNICRIKYTQFFSFER